MKSRRAKSTAKSTKMRTKEDGESGARQYGDYAQSSISDDSEVELETPDDADRQHAMFSE